MMYGKVAPSIAPILTGFVFTLSHHCFDAEITVPIVSILMTSVEFLIVLSAMMKSGL